MQPLTFLAEDDPAFRERLMAAMTEILGARFVGYADGEREARAWFDAHHDGWDLAVLDLHLKDGTGLGVLAGIRPRPGRRHVVILTNSVTNEIRTRALRSGADAVFDKSRELEAFFDYCLAIGDGSKRAPD